MILSASRRTDIPNYYSDWFYNRIKEGFLYVRNPMNVHQVSRIDLSPQIIDCIVFWTKNPKPMINRLKELKEYSYYFQFTLTGYGQDIEENVPHKKEIMIPVFQELSDRVGSQRVIWRYDPILFNDTYTSEYHMTAFEQIAKALKGYTKKCVISFVDIYAKNKKSMAAWNLCEKNHGQMKDFVKKLSAIAQKYCMEIATCAESIDLTDCSVKRNCCIDKELIEEITGSRIKALKDKNQRNACGCIESIDIGTYHTCSNGCKYCYANDSRERVLKNLQLYDVNSPLLCGFLSKEDRVTERKVKSLKEDQLSLWNL